MDTLCRTNPIEIEFLFKETNYCLNSIKEKSSDNTQI